MKPATSRYYCASSRESSIARRRRWEERNRMMAASIDPVGLKRTPLPSHDGMGYRPTRPYTWDRYHSHTVTRSHHTPTNIYLLLLLDFLSYQQTSLRCTGLQAWHDLSLGLACLTLTPDKSSCNAYRVRTFSWFRHCDGNVDLCLRMLHPSPERGMAASQGMGLHGCSP